MTIVYDNKDADITKLVNSDNWKDRIKAAMLISEIEDKEELKKRIADILKLLYDKNLLVRINIINSLKKLILKYPNIMRLLIPRIYGLLHTHKNKTLLSNIKALIAIIPSKLIQEIVIDATNKLYSTNGLERAIGLLDLSTIAVISPEYLKNSLPELMAVSINDKYELLQMFALAIFEEFKENEMKLIFSKLNTLYPYYIVTKNDWSLDSENYDELIHALAKRYFGKIKKDEIRKVLNLLDHNDLLIKLFSTVILKENAKMLWEILNDKEMEKLIQKLMKNLNDKYWTIKVMSLLSLAKILTSCNRDHSSLNWSNYLTEYLSTLIYKSKELLRINFITKAYALKTLAMIYKKYDSADTRMKIEALIEEIDIKEILKEHFIIYFKGISLIIRIKGEHVVDYLMPNIHPNIDEHFIEELKSENLKYDNIFREIEFGLNSDDWLDRLVSARLLGNALYTLPSFAEIYSQLLKTLLKDPVWMTRLTSVWALRIINYIKGLNFTKDDYLDLFEYVDDWYWMIRWEYLMLFFEILNKNPEIFENKELKNALLSTVTTKYLTDSNHIIRKICKYLLQKLSAIDEILSYFGKRPEERIEILQNMIKNPILRKSAFIRIKVMLRKGIKNNNEEKIKRLLNLVNGEYYKETSYILYELVLLYDKYKIAKEMVDTIKVGYPEIIKHRMDLLHRMLSELIVVKRKSALRELKAYVDIDIPITEKILNRLKEMVVYDVVDPAIVKLTIYILEKVGDEEAKQLIKERKELIDVGKDYSLELENVFKDKSVAWYNVYGLIKYMSDDELLNLNSSSLMRLLHVLSKKDTGVILKVRIIDFMIRTIKTDDENFSKVVEDNYEDIFNIIFELMNCEYYLVSERATRLMKAILIKYPLLFRKWIFKKLSRSEDNKQYIALVRKLLDDSSPGIKLEGLYVIECLINRKLYNTAGSFVYEMLELLNDERWSIKKKSLDLILDLDVGSEEVIEEIICKAIKVLKYTDEDFKIYLLRLLNQLPASKKYCKEVLDILSEFKESHDPYIAEIAKNIIRKYSKENSEVNL